VLVESLAYCRERKGLSVFAYVIMPTHFHAIVGADSQSELTPIMRDLKRHTAWKLVETLKAMGWELPLRAFRKAAEIDGRGNEHKVWQEEFHPVALQSEQIFNQKLSYLHENPVRKGLVRKAEDWWYSSARAWLDGEEGPLKVDVLEG
jgi:REP element-mobilizing transposase RayT